MKIGIAAPTEVHSFKALLPAHLHENLPKGTGGTIIPTHLANGLICRGHHVSIYTLDESISEPKVFAGDNLTIFVGNYRKPRRIRMVDLFKHERNTVRNFIELDKPDIVNAHWTYEYALGALSTKVPTIVTARDAPLKILEYDPSLYRLIRLFMAVMTIHRTTHMTAVSSYIAEHIRKYFLYKRDIKIIPNGIDIHKYELIESNNTVEKHKVVFFSIANGWGKRKNEKRLLYAFSKVHLQNPNTELWMFGTDHNTGESACNWAGKRGLTAGVRFLGKNSHSELMEKIASFGDILVHPSLEESFGNIFLEAGLLGKAIIAGKNSGAVPWVLGFGKAGYLIDMRSVKQLENTMLYLAQDATMRKKMGAQAKKFVCENYSLDHMINLYEEAYKNIMAINI